MFRAYSMDWDCLLAAWTVIYVTLPGRLRPLAHYVQYLISSILIIFSVNQVNPWFCAMTINENVHILLTIYRLCQVTQQHMKCHINRTIVLVFWPFCPILTSTILQKCANMAIMYKFRCGGDNVNDNVYNALTRLFTYYCYITYTYVKGNCLPCTVYHIMYVHLYHRKSPHCIWHGEIRWSYMICRWSVTRSQSEVISWLVD